MPHFKVRKPWNIPGTISFACNRCSKTTEPHRHRHMRMDMTHWTAVILQLTCAGLRSGCAGHPAARCLLPAELDIDLVKVPSASDASLALVEALKQLG